MGRCDAACNPEHILLETNTEPGFVGFVYEHLMQKSDYHTQVSMAARMILALHPEAPIDSYVLEHYIQNSEFMDVQTEQDKQIFNCILDKYTKNNDVYSKEEYQDELHGVHHNTASVRCNFDAKIYNNMLN